MKTTKWTIAVGIGTILVAALSSAAGSAQGKDPKNFPPGVTKAMQEHKPGAAIEKVDVETEHGIRFWDIEFKGDRGEMDVAEDGTILDIVTIVQANDLPAPVLASIQKAAGKLAIRRYEKSEVRAEIQQEGGKGKGKIVPLAAYRYVYEAELEKGEVEVAADGTIIKIEK